MGKTRVLITDGMAADGVARLKAEASLEVDLRKSTSKEELFEIIGNYECIIIRSATTLTKELLERASAMKLIVRAGAGVDNIDVPTATSKQIPVMNTASANSRAAAEQTVALMFAMMRFVPQAAQTLRDGKWDRESFKGWELSGRTLGVMGLGNIGRMVATMGHGIGMNVIGFDPVHQADVPGVKRMTSVDELIAQCDVLSLHVPKNKDTTNLINAERISKMKKGSFIVNCSRGGIVDEAAVISALDSGQLNAAAFDVFESEPPKGPNPLFTHPRVACAPHLGASTHEAQERVAATAVDQLLGFFLRGERAGVMNGL
jgi:D-3-phosphoglycerate dehydrogenase